MGKHTFEHRLLKKYYRYIPIQGAYIIEKKGLEIDCGKSIKEELLGLEAELIKSGYKLLHLGSLEYTDSYEYTQLFIVRKAHESPSFVWDSYQKKNRYLNNRDYYLSKKNSSKMNSLGKEV